MKKIGVGIIGLGRIFPRHLDDSIKQINRLELIGVCDANTDLAKKVAAKENVKCYTKYQELLSDKNISVVSVLTPNYLHYKMGMLASQNNKHCVMEKPISQNYRQAIQLVKEFKKYDKKLFPVLQVRYNPAIRVVKDYVEKGYLGKIFTAVLSIHWTRPQEYYDESEWKGRKDTDGGSLLTQAIHYIDSMHYILGKAKSVIAKTGTVGHKIEIEDIANAIIDLENGTRVNFDFTICTYPHNIECSLTILGENGTIKIGGLAMNKIDFWEVKNTPQPYISEGVNPNVYAGGMYIGSCPNHKLIYDNLVNVLINKQKSFINAEDALESLKIIDGIIKSNCLKKEIFL